MMVGRRPFVECWKESGDSWKSKSGDICESCIISAWHKTCFTHRTGSTTAGETALLLNNIFVLDADGNALGAHVFRGRDAGHRLQGNIHQSNDEDKNSSEKTEPQGAVDAGADERVDWG